MTKPFYHSAEVSKEAYPEKSLLEVFFTDRVVKICIGLWILFIGFVIGLILI